MSRSTILRLLPGLALILLLTTLPAAAQTAARTPAVNTTVTSAPASFTNATASAPERVLGRADLLPYLETIRRQYPRLYERLRREVPPDQLE